jgi:hypothetical protein
LRLPLLAFITKTSENPDLADDTTRQAYKNRFDMMGMSFQQLSVIHEAIIVYLLVSAIFVDPPFFGSRAMAHWLC